MIDGFVSSRKCLIFIRSFQQGECEWDNRDALTGMHSPAPVHSIGDVRKQVWTLNRIFNGMVFVSISGCAHGLWFEICQFIRFVRWQTSHVQVAVPLDESRHTAVQPPFVSFRIISYPFVQSVWPCQVMWDRSWDWWRRQKSCPGQTRRSSATGTH